jgi:large subunit ribosomal protein L22
MANNYSLKEYNKESMARVTGMSLPISFKQSIEICNFVRDKSLVDAKNILEKVIKHKQAVPFTRFNSNMGHKRGIGPGRFPKKASKEILDLLNSAEANAQFKGLNTSSLVIRHINANKSSKVMHYGRKRSRAAKRTNVEIVLCEGAAVKKAGNTKEIKKEKVQNKK